MLWHRQAIFKSKGDRLSSSAESRIRTQGLWSRTSSKLNASWQNNWTTYIYIYTYMHMLDLWRPYSRRGDDYTRTHTYIYISKNVRWVSKSAVSYIKEFTQILLCFHENIVEIHVWSNCLVPGTDALIPLNSHHPGLRETGLHQYSYQRRTLE